MDFLKLNPLVEENIILGFPIITNEDIVLNFCLITAKYYIYNSKRKQKYITFMDFLSILKNKLNIEEMICIQQERQEHFMNTWSYLYQEL